MKFLFGPEIKSWCSRVFADTEAIVEPGTEMILPARIETGYERNKTLKEKIDFERVVRFTLTCETDETFFMSCPRCVL